MDRLETMRVFLAVADRGSFVEAARALRLSPAAVTRGVAALEADLGLLLFKRTTRSVRMTEAGLGYAERCRRILQDVEDARAEVRGEDAAPRGTLAVTAPVLFGRLHILPVIEALFDAYPGLLVRLSLVDRVVHMVEEGFDAAVRIGPLPDSALVALPVAEVRRIVVASPAYLEAAGVPGDPTALRAHRIVSFDGLDATRDWRFGAEGRPSVTVAPRLVVNSAEAAIAAATRGQGITRVLSYQAEEGLASGALVRILRDYEPPTIPVNLVTQAARRGAPAIAAFLRAARSYFADRSWP